MSQQQTNLRQRSSMASSAPPPEAAETTPLIGRPGPVKQADNHPLPLNFISGLGFIPLLSTLALTTVILTSTLTYKPFIPFLYHPTAQSLFLLFSTLSILVLQPTHTPAQKKLGQKAHAALMLLALLSLISGVAGIEYNKVANNGPHFHSPHAVIGVVVSVWFFFQYIGGFTMLNVPAVYGGEAKAKAVWKYHRRGGYVLYLGIVAAVVGSAKTDFVAANMFTVGLPLGLGLVSVLGVYARVRKEKLGW